VSIELQTHQDLSRELGRRIERRRLDLGWSRETLGARSAVSPATLRAFERTGQVSLRRLVRLADALGLRDELDQLFRPRPATTLDQLAAWAERRQRGRR
jgi:transcriptional regulator with XRE-family HTH domain